MHNSYTCSCGNAYESVSGTNHVSYNYTYDANGNITKITLSTGAEYRYVYGDIGQLIREDNSTLNRTYVYSYDDAGNILSKKTYALTAAGATPATLYSTYSYGYTDSWGDLLTSYRGVSFTYDEIGNPLTYYNGSSYTFTWENGRRLKTATVGSNTLSYTYNHDGIRTSKTVNGVVHNYTVSGSLILTEEWGTNLVVYLYDANGAPIGMRYRTSSMAEGVFYTFWFDKNLQGDVVAVYNETGTKVLSYTYDAWGNKTTTVHNSSGANSYAQYNAISYRGYYYDTETGLYYVSSRYYDPEIGRWINADGYVSTGQDILGYNMFAYCGNNPVNRVDPTGQFWKELWDAFTQTIQQASGYFTVAAGVSQVDTPVPGPADVASGILLIGGVLVCAGIATYTTITAPAPSISIPKAEEKAEAIVIPKKPDSPVIFPVDPNTFNPVGLVKVPRAGTKNGAFISWMDPLTNTEVFRWDENPNYPNGPHYHINNPIYRKAKVHFYPGNVVPEPYATIYFPFG